ncbi:MULTISPECIES: hypothetical protein [Halocynthiibacter]|uniref:DUF7742 domain-containing protein n=1 Tax=Halocynthiibacter halioticoli TaxID=2986804 RepID=A0AAE3LR28_9RHOB|nr:MULTISPECIES: hypothetical protein [Halocynthiibacter]MCV6824099.1 hypothetical protein [Halocynthiibacter halioticoli]MCW4057100.1 hypothetical protein [Halocynthiibacter sp. SDUM655004]
MRPFLHGDITALARALVALPRADWPRRAVEIMAQAEAADIYRIRTGRAHPNWGNGSLMAAANATEQLPESGLEDRVFCAALAYVFAMIATRNGQETKADQAKVRPFRN